MNYKDYQNALKNLRNDGYDVQVKLNSKLEVLKVEYDRLMTVPEHLQQLEPLTADEFNEMVYGISPVEAIATPSETSKSLEPLQAIAETNIALKPVEVLEPLQANDETYFAKSTKDYWIDRTGVSSQLEITQVQAFRNLQDGWRSLKQLGRNLQSFKKGFDDRLKQLEASKKPKTNNVVQMPLRMPQAA